PGGYVSDGLGLITYNALDRAAEMLIDYKWRWLHPSKAAVGTSSELPAGSDWPPSSVLLAAARQSPEPGRAIAFERDATDIADAVSGESTAGAADCPTDGW
ncbi:hypothetical protein FOZ62_005512, partial [Perkinsus olseni]